MDIGTLQSAYRAGTRTPCAVVAQIYDQIASTGERPVWITLVSREENLSRARALEGDHTARDLPLYGVPFAVKDNFDVQGMPTTAACPGYARMARETATVVQKLLDAGAILIGKTNMDQFATGLVGTRTPYGVCTSVFNPEFISGGSSSGSAVATASGLVSFALGSDTAGSGRVPAAFNHLVGFKPTRGRVSTHGLVPACRSLDCVSIFAETCADAGKVFAVARGFDSRDPYSRSSTAGQGAAPWAGTTGFRFGVASAESRTFFGDGEAEALFGASVEALEGFGGVRVEFDYAPFRKAANLLYKGPWVAERVAAVGSFLDENPEGIDATVGEIIRGGKRYSAVEAFEAAYELEALRKQTAAVWESADFLLLPTAPMQYKVAEVLANPVELNSNLGYYTNFVNLMDLAAMAVPGGFKASGLPFGVSLIGPAFTDEGLLRIADRLHRALGSTLGASSRKLADTAAIEASQAPPGCILMAVVGAHLTGQPLNFQLTERKARLVRSARTHADYRLYQLARTTPPKPGLVYTPGFAGRGIEVEVWAMPEDTVGSFLEAIPPPLALGTIRLADGSMVKGFLCEPSGIEGAREITEFGGWRGFLAHSQKGIQ
ncbi:MAG TPA: allophanate hydrolase [Terracidiphilus sp.]|nr:allophanate hydrolase [Terracidiphilus sp.]